MASEIKLTLTGYRVEDALPEESGEYLVFKVFSSVSGMFTDMHYSASHRAWNVHDNQDEKFVAEHKIHGITHWFPVPATIAEIEKGVADHG